INAVGEEEWANEFGRYEDWITPAAAAARGERCRPTEEDENNDNGCSSRHHVRQRDTMWDTKIRYSPGYCVHLIRLRAVLSHSQVH
ncbi:unnamed protein product, partial [Strongylus vulgaris]